MLTRSICGDLWPLFEVNHRWASSQARKSSAKHRWSFPIANGLQACKTLYAVGRLTLSTRMMSAAVRTAGSGSMATSGRAAMSVWAMVNRVSLRGLSSASRAGKDGVAEV